MDIDQIVEKHRHVIQRLVPESSVVLSGSASVGDPGANDVDLVVLVADVADASDRLRGVYAPLFEEEWREDWAAFRERGAPQVDVVVTRVGTKGDAHHRRAWAVLAADEQLLAEYRRLKAIDEHYEERKAAFFERVVAQLPPVDDC